MENLKKYIDIAIISDANPNHVQQYKGEDLTGLAITGSTLFLSMIMNDTHVIALINRDRERRAQ